MNALTFALSFLRAHWKLIGAAFLLLALIIQTFRLSATDGAEIGVQCRWGLIAPFISAMRWRMLLV